MTIFLDHNSTTPLDPRVLGVMIECERAGFLNPASQHAEGRRARRTLEEARRGIAAVLGGRTGGMDEDRLIFTSGGTESNNLAILGLSAAGEGQVIVSAIEHPSAAGPCEELARRGSDVRTLRIDSRGVADLSHLEELLTRPTRLVVLMLGNNETGVLQPVEAAARLCRDRGVPLHTDAVQVAGKLPVDFQRLGVAALSLSAHKFHGPRGIGGLLVRGDMADSLSPIFFGGFQQMGLRPGSESVAPAVAMRAALDLWRAEAEDRRLHMCRLRDRLEETLLAAAPRIIVHGKDAPRLPHTSNISFPGADRQALLMALDREGVACSTGSACASGSSEPSPVLLAMNLPASAVESSLRFSLGAGTTEAEIDEAASKIARIYARLD